LSRNALIASIWMFIEGLLVDCFENIIIEVMDCTDRIGIAE